MRWLAGIAFALAASFAAEARPARVVSINLCTDQLAVLLAHPNQLLSVSWLARDRALSPVHDRLAGIAINHAQVEDVLPLRPDLVLAGRFAARQTQAVLARLGFRVIALDIPTSLDQALAAVESVGRALDNFPAAEALVHDLRARLAALPPLPPDPPLAAVLEPRGVTVGPGTLFDDVLRRAGYSNLAARLGLGAYGELPLEIVIKHRPAALIVTAGERPVPSLAEAALAHGALSGMRRIEVPSALTGCGGPFSVDLAERLARARS
ncbi:MAG: ABC transporter substrate-binding protein [Alphaproteobacteria bacterium]|nr:ABC transporter substrate-binding protein [Alphaproteobacteria bacterium]